MSSNALTRAIEAADRLNPSDRMALLKCLVDRLAAEHEVPDKTPTIRSKKILDFVLDRIVAIKPGTKKKLLAMADTLLKIDGGLTPADQVRLLDALPQRGISFWGGAEYARYESHAGL